MRHIQQYKFYNTQAWKKAREAYKKQVGGLCERCLAKGIIRPGEFVHHKIYIDLDNVNDPSVTLNFDNLELLCREHHAAEHAKKRYVVDENGYVYGR